MSNGYPQFSKLCDPGSRSSDNARDQIGASRGRRIHVDKEFRFQLPTLNRDATSALGTEKIESEVNRFSAELLMPTA